MHVFGVRVKAHEKKKIGTIILNEGKRLESSMSTWSSKCRGDSKNFYLCIVQVLDYSKMPRNCPPKSQHMTGMQNFKRMFFTFFLKEQPPKASHIVRCQLKGELHNDNLCGKILDISSPKTFHLSAF